jgi:hypothetical protein
MMFSKEASERKHRSRILIAWIISMAFVGAFAAYGFDYYTLAWKDRPFSPKHMLLRPSGPVGVNLGVFGFAGSRVGRRAIILRRFVRCSKDCGTQSHRSSSDAGRDAYGTERSEMAEFCSSSHR